MSTLYKYHHKLSELNCFLSSFSKYGCCKASSQVILSIGSYTSILFSKSTPSFDSFVHDYSS